MSYTVYVLSSTSSKKSYVGYTNNLKRRLLEHNRGKGYYTRQFGPWVVVHTEEYRSLNEAKNRERYLKSHSGRQKILKEIFRNLEK